MNMGLGNMKKAVVEIVKKIPAQELLNGVMAAGEKIGSIFKKNSNGKHEADNMSIAQQLEQLSVFIEEQNKVNNAVAENINELIEQNEKMAAAMKELSGKVEALRNNFLYKYGIYIAIGLGVCALVVAIVK